MIHVKYVVEFKERILRQKREPQMGIENQGLFAEGDMGKGTLAILALCENLRGVARVYPLLRGWLVPRIHGYCVQHLFSNERITIFRIITI